MKIQILEYLNSAFGVEGEDAEELFSTYVESIDENCGKLGRESASRDFPSVSKTAHTIKGCALNCGHAEMAEAAKAAEAAAKAGDAAALAELAEQMCAIRDSLLAESES